MEQGLSPLIILTVVSAYFLLLVIVSFVTSGKGSNEDFFIGSRKSPWYLVAFGMIGASLSGVTFISIPGAVGAGGGNQAFSYMQMVFGYFLGYIVIAHVLMPLYYRMNLTSIYTYLDRRLGFESYKTGAAFFLLSRTIGASFRLYLVAIVLQKFVMDAYHIPFAVTVGITIFLIWIYTNRAGIKTIVYTDTVQTVCMLVAVIGTILAIQNHMQLSVGEMVTTISESEYGKMFFFEEWWTDSNNFFKQFIGGALITVVMTGLDQDMMQKNLSCKNIKDAQRNMYSFSIILVIVNLLFLSLGALLYIYAEHTGFRIPERADQLYPALALTSLPTHVGVLFVVGLIAAAYSSADSALTSLTTSFCVDFLDFEKNKLDEVRRRQTRKMVHIGFSVLLFLVIIAFNAYNEESVINRLFQFANYTYGPLLGLFMFGMMTKKHVKGWGVVAVCISAAVISIILDLYSASLFNGFKFGYLILAVNGMLAFVGLYALSLTQKNEK